MQIKSSFFLFSGIGQVLSNTEEVVVKAHNYVLTHEEEALKQQVLAQMNVVLQAVIDWLDKTILA